MLLRRSLQFGLREHVIGGAVAAFFLVGRWSLSRLGGPSLAPPFWSEPRFWLVATMCFGLLLPAWRRPDGDGRPRMETPGGLFTVLFFLWIGLSSFWAPDAPMAQVKLYETALVFLAVLALRAAWHTGDPAALAHAIWLYLVIGCGALALLGLASVGDERLAVLGGGPNTFGRNMGLLAFGAWYALEQDRRAWLWIPAMTVAGFLVVLTGSRGAMLSLALALVFFLFTERRRAGKRILVLGALGLVAGAVLFGGEFGQRSAEMFESRVTVTTLLERHSAGRDRIFAESLNTGFEHPYAGIGLNGFQAREGTYPHNVFLEAFSEAGFTGLFLLLGMLGAYASGMLRRWHRVNKASMAAALLLLVSAQFSGDFFDSRGLFLMLLVPFHQPPSQP